MPQMTPAQARVMDPVLTNIARGYQNAEFVGNALFPKVPVQQRGGRVVKFGKEAFKLYNTVRAPGSNVAEMQFGYSSDPIPWQGHALRGKIPLEDMEDASAVPGIDLGQIAVVTVLDVINLSLEYSQAQLARDADNYDDDNVAEPSGDSKWTSSKSDPIAVIEALKEIVRKKIGKRPNSGIIGGAVFAALKTHPAVIDRIKYTGRDVPTLELLASLFDVRTLKIGDAIFCDSAGELQDVWGGDAVFGYTDISDLKSKGKPSFAYTYELGGGPRVMEAFLETDNNSWMYPVFHDVSPVIAGADAGFLVKGRCRKGEG